jgi:hypothetical protein
MHTIHIMGFTGALSPKSKGDAGIFRERFVAIDLSSALSKTYAVYRRAGPPMAGTAAIVRRCRSIRSRIKPLRFKPTSW